MHQGRPLSQGTRAAKAEPASCGAPAQVQDEAAGLVVATLDPQPGEQVLDCCAAPGGKALFAAARMQGQVGSARQLLQACVGSGLPSLLGRRSALGSGLGPRSASLHFWHCRQGRS